MPDEQFDPNAFFGVPKKEAKAPAADAPFNAESFFDVGPEPEAEKPAPKAIDFETKMRLLNRAGYDPGPLPSMAGEGRPIAHEQLVEDVKRKHAIYEEAFKQTFPGAKTAEDAARISDSLDMIFAKSALSDELNKIGTPEQLSMFREGGSLSQLAANFHARRGTNLGPAAMRELLSAFQGAHDLNTPEGARAFSELIAQERDERAPGTALTLIGSFADSATAGALSDDEYKEYIGEGRRVLSEQHGFAGDMAGAAADIGGAMIPLGRLHGAIQAGMVRAGASKAFASKTSLSMAMGVYGAVGGGAEGASQGVAFGFLAPAMAVRVRHALSRVPPRLQAAAGEAIGFALAGQAVHGGGLDQAKVDAALGALLGFAAGPTIITRDKMEQARLSRRRDVLDRRKGRRRGEDPVSGAEAETAKAEARFLRRQLGKRATDPKVQEELGVHRSVKRRIREQEAAGDAAGKPSLEGGVIERPALPQGHLPADAPALPRGPLTGTPQPKKAIELPKAKKQGPPVARDNILEGAPFRDFGDTSKPIPMRRVPRDVPAPANTREPGRVEPKMELANKISPAEKAERDLLQGALEKYGPGKGVKAPATLGAGPITTKDILLGALDVPRGTPTAILNVANKIVTTPFKGVMEGARMLRDSVRERMGNVAGLPGAARTVARLKQDGMSAGRILADLMVDAQYQKDAVALEIKAGIHEKARVRDPVTGKKRMPTRIEQENAALYQEGGITRRQAEGKGVPKEYLDSIDFGRQEIDRLHNEIHKRGLIRDETHANYDGRFIRREYTKKLMEELVPEFAKTGSKRIPRIRLKMDELGVRWVEGGKERVKKFPIKDFGSEAEALAARDAFFKTKRREAVEEVEGIKATARRGRLGTPSIRQVKKFDPLSQEARADLGEIRDPRIREARTLAAQQHIITMDNILGQVAKDGRLSTKVPKGKDAPEGFRRIPDDSRYGKLRDMAVKKEIYDEIVGTFGQDGVAHKMLFRFMDQFASQWKLGKTIWNPATHAHNATGNIVFAELAGISPLRPSDYPHFLHAWRLFGAKRGTPEFALLKALTRGGVGRNEGISRDMMRLMESVQDASQGATTYHGLWKKVLGRVKEGRVAEAVPGFDKARALYEAEDVVYKMAFALKRLKKGDSLSEAIRKTNRYFPNYNQNPVARLQRSKKSVPTVARSTVLPPFLSFTAEAARIMAVHAMERPVSLAAGLGAMTAVTSWARHALGLSEEDLEMIRRNGPEWSPAGGTFTPLLPWMNADGEAQMIDLRWVYPGAELFMGAEGIFTGRGLLGSYGGLANHPFLAPLEDAIRKRDRLTGREIFPDRMPESDHAEALADYFLKAWAPSMTPGIGRSFQRMKEGVTGEVIQTGRGLPNRWGDRRSLMESFMDTFIGLRTREIHPGREQGLKVQEVKRKIAEKRKGVREAIQANDMDKLEALLSEIDALIKRGKKSARPLSRRLRSLETDK